MKQKKPRQTFGPEHQDKLREIFAKAANETPTRRHAMSMRHLIEDLKDDIRALRERGYTIDQICRLVTGADEFQALAPSTLRRYVSAATGKRRRRRGGGSKGRATPATPAPGTGPNADAGEARPGDETTPAGTRRGEFEAVPDREDL